MRKKLILQKGSVLRHFYTLKDFRQEKKIKHKLIDIIVIIICAVASGAETFADIALYAMCMEEWLKSILELPNGIPSHDTIERIMQWLDPDEFRKCFLNWVRGVAKITNGEVVAIDGKALRGSKDGEKAPIYMVSAWARANGIVLGQMKVNEKTNEIKAIPELLKILAVKGCIVTIDAMGCQKDIAKEIISKEADYVLSLKENHPLLHQEVEQFFMDCRKDDFRDIAYDYHEEYSKGHGRIEKRRYWITEQIEWLSAKEEWEGLKSIGMTERICEQNGVKTIEVRYHLCSIPQNAKQYVTAVRGHWGIENSLHWVLDVVFMEDGSRIRKDHGPENMALVRHVFYNLLKNDKETKLSMRQKKLKAEWSHDYAMSLVFGNLSGEID
jgi:predicted transposase YbfD/YdcC